MVRIAMYILVLVLGVCLLTNPARAYDDWVMDVDNHTASLVGTWGTNNTPILFYGDDFRWAACSGSSSITASATFTADANPDVNGYYSVFVRWTVHPNRSTAAHYRIYQGATLVGQCFMNQQVRGGEWVRCANVYLLDTSTNPSVVLGNDCAAGSYVVADAVRFVKQNIDANDIVDEPGLDWVAGGSHSSGYTITSTSSSTPNTITSQTISCPESGYVLATLSAHTTSDTGVGLNFSLSLSSAFADPPAHAVFNPATGYSGQTVHIQRVDSCPAGGGSLTYYFLGYKYGTTSNAGYVWYRNMSLQYFPTRY